MFNFIHTLILRNPTLFYFGLICLVAALVFLVLTRTSKIIVLNVNAWYKPFKFAFSTFLYAWAMAWYCYYLTDFNIQFFNWTTIVLLGFEIVYIAIQANKGQLSHFNLTTRFYATMYSLMAIAASLVTIYTAYIGVLFFNNNFPALPDYYVWSIRLGILIFVVFSFQGFLMGSTLNHSVGAKNDNSNMFIVGWSKKVGDLRVAHFIGMHALQVLPFISYYLLKNTTLTIIVALLYAALALFTLIQALQGKPLIKSNS